MFSRKVHNLRHFGFRYLICIDAALAYAMVVDMQHNSGRRLVVLAEEPLQHVHDELHGRVVVVEDEHAVHARPLGLRLGLADDGGAGAPRLPSPLAVVVSHAR